MTEIDECTEGTHLCSQLCINTNGSYICDCRSGFIIDVDERTCDGEAKVNNATLWVMILCIHKFAYIADINECSDGIHSCQQVCNNTHGSHHCLCRQGYQLNSDNYTCRG